MAKKDAIFDYGSSFDTSSYLTGISSDWDNNVGDALNIRFDLLWRGTPRAETVIHNGSSTAAISGWDVGTWKKLDVWNVSLDASVGGGFQSWSHRLIYDIKRAFNLPNQEDLDTWKDEYTRDTGEEHYLWWQAGGRTPWPMVMSHPTKGGMRGGDASGIREDRDFRCALVVPVKGFSFYGGADNEDSVVVWPTSTNIDTMNNHYKSLEDASTAAADWTSPTKVGTEFTSSSSVHLINFENYWQGKPTAAPTDTLSICIGWNSHSYADIKALIDAAIA